MREIKFRAWDKVNKIMNEVCIINFDDNNVGLKPDYDYTLSFEDIELMQYTGLKDKNGKEIYEGDIVKSNYKTGNLVVFFVRGCFRLTYSKELIGIWLEIHLFEELEVIGNIYENPELLEG